MTLFLKLKLIPKVIFICLLTATLVFGGVGLYILSSVKSDRMALLEQGINSDASFVVSRFEEKQNSVRETIKIISQNRQIKKALRLNQTQGLNEELNALILHYPFINHILITDNDGDFFSSNTETINEIHTDGKALFLKEITNNKHYIVPDVDDIGINDIGPDPYLSNIGENKKSGQWFTMNIFKRETPLGQVIINIDWQTTYANLLDEAITELSMNKNSIVAGLLTNNENKIIVLRYNSKVSSSKSHQINSYYKPHADELSASKLLQLKGHNLSSILIFNHNAESKTIQNVVNKIVLITIGSILFMSLLLYVLFKRVLLIRISQLLQSTKHIGEGNFEHQVSDLGFDEIGDLGRDFNAMSMQLSKNTTSIDLLNEESELRRLALKDLSQQKRILAEKSEQLSLVIDTTAVGVWDWQVQTGEVVFNERWAEIIGYTLTELAESNNGQLNVDTWLNHAHPDDLARSGLLLTQHWSGETKRYSYEARMKHKLGHWVWVLDSGQVVEWHDDGSPKRMIGTHQDITERIEGQQALIEAKNYAEEAAIAKSDFLASMSHEIRTPMNGVLGMLGLLSGGVLTDEQQHRVDIAQGSAQSLLHLINDILDFSKVDAGKMELETIDFDLPSMLGEFTESMALQVQEKGVELVLDIAQVDESMVKGDSNRLRQILTNIVSNASKFTEEGEIVIQVVLTDIHDGNCRLDFRISDTGIGIPKGNISTLFDSFSQVDASTTRKFGGTGLGLAIVNKLCKLMGGNIEVTSIENEGSIFNFHVILQISPLSKKITPPVNLDNINLLIVDDNTSNREAIYQQLTHWGANVITAAGALEAMSLCEKQLNKNIFDMIFIDMEMPKMDGIQLAEKFNSDIRFKNTKLILMTPMSYKVEETYIRGVGFTGYFPKPTTTLDLFSALSLIKKIEVDKKTALAVRESFIINTANSYDFEGLRILLVEDNNINRKVATGILNKFGITLIDFAINGYEAIDALKESQKTVPYSIILMDCQMPEMDGYEATINIRAGRAGENNKDLPIIAMTANAMSGDKEKCLAAGMTDYLSKPIDPQQFLSMLKLWGIDRKAIQDPVN